MPFLSALEVVYDDKLFKSTFTLLTYFTLQEWIQEWIHKLNESQSLMTEQYLDLLKQCRHVFLDVFLLAL